MDGRPSVLVKCRPSLRPLHCPAVHPPRRPPSCITHLLHCQSRCPTCACCASPLWAHQHCPHQVGAFAHSSASAQWVFECTSYRGHSCASVYVHARMCLKVGQVHAHVSVFVHSVLCMRMRVCLCTDTHVSVCACVCACALTCI